jgi:hypothetical protein
MPASMTRIKQLGLHEAQLPVYDHPARFKVVAAGRRWGKTELALMMLLTGGADGRGCLTHPALYRYVAPTQKLARKTLWRRKLKRALDPTWLAKPLHETHLEVNFKNGSILEVLGAEEEGGLRGEGVTGVVLDEYAEMREAAWPEEVRPSLADMKGWALFIGTPQSFNHFHAMYLRGQSNDHPTWASWQFESLQNPLLDSSEVEEAKRTTDPRTFRQEYQASFESIGGRAYTFFDRKVHVKPVELVSGVPVAIAFDFNVQPATAVIGQGVKDECRVWREVFLTHRGGEATRACAFAVRDWLQSVGWSGQIRVYADATGRAMKTTGPSDHAVLMDVFKGATWWVPSANPHPRDRVAAVNGRCMTADGKTHLIIDPRNERLIADLEQVTFADNGELDQKTNPLLTHISDAFGYWVYQEWPPVKTTLAAAAHVPQLHI